MDEWITKSGTHRMENYSILSHVLIQMNLEASHKTKNTALFHLSNVYTDVKFIETESRIMVTSS